MASVNFRVLSQFGSRAPLLMSMSSFPPAIFPVVSAAACELLVSILMILTVQLCPHLQRLHICNIRLQDMHVLSAKLLKARRRPFVPNERKNDVLGRNAQLAYEFELVDSKSEILEHLSADKIKLTPIPRDAPATTNEGIDDDTRCTGTEENSLTIDIDTGRL